MRVAPVDAYWKIVGSVEDTSALSYRKQVCIAYMKWLVFAEDKDRVNFIEMTLAWRKVEKRVGGKRSLLEKKMRKMLRKWRKHKALAPSRKGAGRAFQRLRKEKRGIFSDDYRKNRMREVNSENMRKQLEAGRHPSAKEWIVHEPDGTVVRIWNLQKYARERGLSRTQLRMTSCIPGRTYKGYRCEIANSVIENL